MDSNKPRLQHLAFVGVSLLSGALLHCCYDGIENKYLDNPVKVETQDSYNLSNSTYYTRNNPYIPGKGNFQFTYEYEKLQLTRQQYNCCHMSPDDLDYIQSMFEYYLDDPMDEIRFPPEYFETARD